MPPSMSLDAKWTTQDEILHIRRLAARPDPIPVLEKYLHLCRTRDWTGAGMHVDPGQVILACEDAITAIKRSAELAEAERMAAVLRRQLGYINRRQNGRMRH